MEKVDHTPGPWMFSETIGNYVVTLSDGRVSSFPKSLPNAKGNACLVAASPELLAYLEKLMDVSLEHGVSGHLPIFELCHDAISKARGKIYG